MPAPAVNKRYSKLQPEDIQEVIWIEGNPQLHEDKKKIPVFHAYLDSILAEKAEGSILLKKNPVLPENTLYLLAWPKL